MVLQGFLGEVGLVVEDPQPQQNASQRVEHFLVFEVRRQNILQVKVSLLVEVQSGVGGELLEEVHPEGDSLREQHAQVVRVHRRFFPLAEQQVGQLGLFPLQRQTEF